MTPVSYILVISTKKSNVIMILLAVQIGPFRQVAAEHCHIFAALGKTNSPQPYSGKNLNSLENIYRECKTYMRVSKKYFKIMLYYSTKLKFWLQKKKKLGKLRFFNFVQWCPSSFSNISIQTIPIDGILDIWGNMRFAA